MTSSETPSAAAPRHHFFLESRGAFDDFIQRWESGRLTRQEWTHGAHLAAGACYVIRFGEGASDELRRSIKRHNVAVGTLDTETSGYHESLTRVWAAVVSRCVSGLTDPWLAARRAVETFGEDRDLPRRCYSFDVVKDTRARASWVPPDLNGPY